MEKYRQLAKRLTKAPPKEKRIEIAHFRSDNNIICQADILFVYPEHGYKYILVVVNVHNRIMDAEPITNKSSAHMIEAFDKILARKIINTKGPNQFTYFQSDKGTEFTSEQFKRYLKRIGITKIRFGEGNRHRNQTVVEKKNLQLSKCLYEYLAAIELSTGEVYTDWVSELRNCVDKINKSTRKNYKPRSKADILVDSIQLPKNKVIELIPLNTNVHFKRDKAADVKGNDYGNVDKFRATDYKFSPKTFKVSDILLRPGLPPMYKVDNDRPTYYTRKQLLLK